MARRRLPVEQHLDLAVGERCLPSRTRLRVLKGGHLCLVDLLGACQLFVVLPVGVRRDLLLEARDLGGELVDQRPQLGSLAIFLVGLEPLRSVAEL